MVGGALARILPRNAAPVPYVSRSGSTIPLGGLFNRGSQAAQLAAMGSVSTLFAIVSARSEATAAVEWWVDRVSVDRRMMYDPAPPGRSRLARHPAMDLLNANPFYSRHDLFEVGTQHICLVGESTWVIATNPAAPRLPLELWPVRPDRMSPVPHPTDFLSGWVYTAPGGEKVPLDTWQVVQVKLPNPLDPYRGMGPVQALLADLDSVRYSAEWNRRFFLNDATPGGIVELEDSLTDREFNKFRDRWYEQHRGVGNAHRVAFLEKATWKDRQFSMRDMQFTELRNVSRDLIREAFRMHKATLGLADDVNRANADAADYQEAKRNVDPLLSRFRGALNGKIMPLYGDPVTAEYCYENPAKEDEQVEAQVLASRTASYKTLTDAGVDPADAAMVTGLPPMRHSTPAPVPAPDPAMGAA